MDAPRTGRTGGAAGSRLHAPAYGRGLGKDTAATAPPAGTERGSGGGWREHPAVRPTLLTLGTLAGVAVVLVLAALGLRAAEGDAVLAGVSVDGEPVAGLTRTEIEATVQQQADERTDGTVTVVADEERLERTRGDADDIVHAEQAVEQA